MDSESRVERERGLGMDEIRGVLRRRRRLLIGVMVVVLGGVTAYTFLSPPVYEAAVAIYLKTPSSGALSGLASALPALGGITGGTSDQDAHNWLIMNPPSLEQAAREVGIKKPLNKLLKIVRCESVGTSLVVVYVDDTKPQRAADFANKLAKEHETQWETSAKAGTDRAMNFLRGQVDTTQKKLSKTEESYRDYLLNHGIVDLTAESGKAVSVIGDLAEMMYTAQGESTAAQRTADYYRRQLQSQSRNYVASSTIARNPLVQAAETNLAQLETERASQAILHGPEHYRMKQLDEQVAQTKGELAKAVKTVVASQVQADNPLWTTSAQALAVAEADVHASQAKQGAIRDVLDREKNRWQEKVPNEGMAIGRLQRDTLIGSTVYGDLLKNYYETCLKELQDQAVVEIVSPATKPDTPIRPKPILYMVLGFLFSVLLGFMELVAAEVFGDTLRSARQAQIELGPNALASVPNVSWGSPLLTEEGGRNRAQLLDVFRGLRTNLRFATPTGMPHALLVTGAAPREGVTTVATNLGVGLAQQGARTLLVDANLRTPGLHRATNVAGDHGLSDVLAGDADPLSMVQATATPNLSVLPAGPVPPNPIELLDSERARATMATLRKQFDAIVVDGPGYPHPDVLALASLCDASLLVVRLGWTRRRNAVAAANQLAVAGKPPLGLVANRV